MSEVSETKREITVLGAGVVGLCCAVRLRRAGFAVTLVDRDEPGSGTSFGNAGLIQTDAVVPIATPGTLRRVPEMLFDPRGPLVVRWGYLPRIAPWLVRFLMAARPAEVERISIALASILDRAHAAWSELVDAAGAGDLWRETGELHVYRRKAAWEAARSGHDLRRRRGARVEDLTPAELRQLEPALTPDLYAGIFMPNAAALSHPFHLSQRLSELFARDGGVFRRENVTGIRAGRPGGPVELVTESGHVEAQALVIAAGAFSRRFAQALGCPVPLDTERGYHLWLPTPGIEMRRPVVVGDHRFVIVPMTGGIRLAGTAELGGLDLPPDWRRADMLAGLAAPYVPGLNADGGERWMGYRPSMPDSLPVIGTAPGRANVLFAFGHGHLGLTMAAETGRIIAGLATGGDPGFDISPFRPDRF